MARAIIFDFDLTLADPTKGTIECVNFALEKLNLPQADDERIKRTIGMSIEDTFLSLTGQTNNQNVSLFVSNGEDVAEHKPHPSGLIIAISRMQMLNELIRLWRT